MDYTCPNQLSSRMTLSDLEWFSDILNNTKHARSFCDRWASCCSWRHQRPSAYATQWEHNEHSGACSFARNQSRHWHFTGSRTSEHPQFADGWPLIRFRLTHRHWASLVCPVSTSPTLSLVVDYQVMRHPWWAPTYQ